MATPVVLVANMAAYTPAETVELISRAGVKKGNMRPDKVFLSSVSAGCLLSFAAAAYLSANTAPIVQTDAPGLIRLVGALIFPMGLVMIVLTGADLFTGTTMYTTVSVLHRRLSIQKMLLHWFICFWGNLAGSLLTMVLIFGYGGVFELSPYRDEVVAFVTKKQLAPAFHQIFLRAIGCNWLVCLACFFAAQARDMGAKILGVWWPVFAFVTLGLDHVVANMFFVPLGIFLGTPGVTVGLYIWKGIIPATLGNVIGGALFVGVYYWWMYLFQEPETAIDGVYFDHHHYQPPSRGSNDIETGSNSKAHQVVGQIDR